MEKKTIGSFISALRRAAGMTQRDLAEQLNVSDKAVSRWERDESAPDLTLLPIIADLFGIAVDELLRGQRKPAADATAPTESTGEESATPSVGSNSKRQKMLFGNRLRKQKMLNYIPLGLFAAGVIAALLCNFAFYRAALGFFLGLLFETAAVICALAFGSAAMPVGEEDYDAALLQEYKKGVIRTACLPVCLAALTLPLLAWLLFTWLQWGAFVGLAYTELLLPLLATLILALLLHEIVTFGILPAIARRHGVVESEREVERRAGVKRLAKRCALSAAIAMVLPAIAMGVLSSGMVGPDTAFAKGESFDDFDDFAAYMAQEGRHGTTDNWSEDDFIYGPSIHDPRPPRDEIIIEENVEHIYGELEKEDNGTASDKIDSIDPDAPSYPKQHQVIWSEDGTILAEFDWINADVAHISWSFDQNEDGTPITVYTYNDCINSHRIYDALMLALGILIVAIPVSAAIVYGVKRRKV